MINDIRKNIRSSYNINVEKYIPFSNKSGKILCSCNSCYFVKKTGLYTDVKYKLLYNQGIRNVLYPKKNINNKFVDINGDQLYIVSDYFIKDVLSDEYIASHLLEELKILHEETKYKKVLSPKYSRYKMEQIYEYLLYKFNLLESFVRTVENSEYTENSILILKNYHYIMDTKKIMAKINKKLIVDVKNNKSVYYSFIHNNPKKSHLLVSNGNSYLISLEKSKMGIPSLDIVKFYLENESLNIDIKELIIDYFSKYDDDFYINYFYFFVMLYYIKGIVIINNDYITSQSIVFATKKLSLFIERFSLNDLN